MSRVVTGLLHSLIDFAYDVGGTIPAHFYSNSLKYTRQTLLSDAAVDRLFQYFDDVNKGTLVWFVVWDLNGGRIKDIPQTATAYWHRDALHFQQAYVVSLLGPVSPTSRQFLIGLNQLCRQLHPGIDESAYAGYVDDALYDPLTAYSGDPTSPGLSRSKECTTLATHSEILRAFHLQSAPRWRVIARRNQKSPS